MSCHVTRISFAIAATIAVTAAVAAPKPKKPAPKPAKVTKPVKPAPRTLQGTKQFSGDQAVLGQEYTLGKASPMNFKLNSVEYSTDRVRIGNEAYQPAASEKVLILRYTLHNPRSEEQIARYDTFHFTAVDDTNTNHEAPQAVGAESTQLDLDISLKPGQKVDGYTYIPVPAKGTVPKLIVKSSDDLVLRYDLKGKVKPLAGPAVDPAVKDGATALSEVPAQIGKTYQMGVFDITIDAMAYSTTALKDQELGEGERNFLVSATVKNGHPADQLLRYDTVQMKYEDQDGAEISYSQDLLAASRDVSFDTNLALGKSAKVRFPVKVAKDQQVAKVTMSQGDSPRTYVFDTRSVK